MPTTLEDFKNDKADLEERIRKEVIAFQEEYGVSVDRVSLDTRQTPKNENYILDVDIEISL